MLLENLGEKLNRLWYRGEIKRLTKEQLQMAEEWSLDFIRANHPKWTEDQVRRYYDSMLYVRVTVVDEWSRKFRSF